MVIHVHAHVHVHAHGHAHVDVHANAHVHVHGHAHDRRCPMPMPMPMLIHMSIRAEEGQPIRSLLSCCIKPGFGFDLHRICLATIVQFCVRKHYKHGGLHIHGTAI